MIISLCLMGFFISLSTFAQPKINDMHMCQALIAVLEDKANQASYSGNEKSQIKKGLAAYDEFIELTVIKPGIEALSQGNSDVLQSYQHQMNEAKKTYISHLHKRHSTSNITMDLIVSLNNCTQKALPNEPALTQLKTSMQTLLKHASK